MKTPVVMARIIKHDEDHGEFDYEFWRRVGHEGRFAAAWGMIYESELMKGKHVTKSRLQRTVQNIKRRTS
jgi:hypothetical protein